MTTKHWIGTVFIGHCWFLVIRIWIFWTVLIGLDFGFSILDLDFNLVFSIDTGF